MKSLAPSEESVQTWDLSEFFDLSKPGRYTVRLTWPQGNVGNVVTVSSNSIELVI
jgi:hypothetical protein